MRHGRTGVARGGLLIAALVLAAGCAGPGGGDGDTECDVSRGTLTVGLVAPLSGELASVGLGMRNAVDLAVNQANQACSVPGHRVVLDARDDRADPETGAAAARTLAEDPSLIGVIGPYNSSVGLAMQPVLGDASVVAISPGTTAVQLTRGTNPVTAPLRQHQTFFRTVATDAVQGPAAAAYMARDVGRMRVAVVSDGNTYGEGLAAEFAKQLPTLGGEVTSRTRLPAGTPPATVAAQITAGAPDAVFYGGEYPAGGPLSQALGAAGFEGPLMGGDGIVNDDYVAAGGREGDLGTSVGAPAETLPGARAFVEAYQQAGYPEGFGFYGPSAFDAANVLVGATATVLGEDGTWTPERRPELVRAVQNHAAEGVTGSLAFDRYGDVLTDTVSVYRVDGGSWVPVAPGA